MYKGRLAALKASLILAALSAGCTGADRMLEDARKGRSSAEATARATVDAWARGQVSPRFAHLAFSAARTRVEKDRARLARKDAVAADDRVRSMVADLEQVSARLAELATAAERGDVATAEALARELRAASGS
jgi:hypothetical protein